MKKILFLSIMLTCSSIQSMDTLKKIGDFFDKDQNDLTLKSGAIIKQGKVKNVINQLIALEKMNKVAYYLFIHKCFDINLPNNNNEAQQVLLNQKIVDMRGIPDNLTKDIVLSFECTQHLVCSFHCIDRNKVSALYQGFLEF